MEPLPDLTSLSDSDLKRHIDELTEQEREVSYRRRLLHGQIDILRAELQSRLKKQVDEGESPFTELDIQKLTEILTSKASPPSDEELAALSDDK